MLTWSPVCRDAEYSVKFSGKGQLTTPVSSLRENPQYFSPLEISPITPVRMYSFSVSFLSRNSAMLILLPSPLGPFWLMVSGALQRTLP